MGVRTIILGEDRKPMMMKVTCIDELEDGSMNVEVDTDEEGDKEIFSEGVSFLLLKGLFEMSDDEVVQAMRSFSENRDKELENEDDQHTG